MIERTNREVVCVNGREVLELFRDGTVNILGVYGKLSSEGAADVAAALFSVYCPNQPLPADLESRIEPPR